MHQGRPCVPKGHSREGPTRGNGFHSTESAEKLEGVTGMNSAKHPNLQAERRGALSLGGCHLCSVLVSQDCARAQGFGSFGRVVLHKVIKPLAGYTRRNAVSCFSPPALANIRVCAQPSYRVGDTACVAATAVSHLRRMWPFHLEFERVREQTQIILQYTRLSLPPTFEWAILGALWSTGVNGCNFRRQSGHSRPEIIRCAARGTLSVVELLY